MGDKEKESGKIRDAPYVFHSTGLVVALFRGTGDYRDIEGQTISWRKFLFSGRFHHPQYVTSQYSAWAPLKQGLELIYSFRPERYETLVLNKNQVKYLDIIYCTMSSWISAVVEQSVKPMLIMK
jgi:hypothetical protein